MNVNPYLFFDDIVCINLHHRYDKKQISQSIFKLLDIKSRFHTVHKHPNGGIHGCFESHIQVIQEAYDKGLNNILIFEDDIKVTPSYSKAQVEKCVKFMKSNKSWDIFYLGYLPHNTNRGSIQDFLTAEFINNHIIRFRPFATQAYCLSRKGMKRILDTYKDYIGKIHVDQYIVNMKLESYCTVPLLFDQYLCLGSDNDAFDSYEVFLRRFQCKADMYDLLYRPTLVKYKFHKHRSQCIVCILILLLLVGAIVGIVKLKPSIYL